MNNEITSTYVTWKGLYEVAERANLGRYYYKTSQINVCSWHSGFSSLESAKWQQFLTVCLSTCQPFWLLTYWKFVLINDGLILGFFLCVFNSTFVLLLSFWCSTVLCQRSLVVTYLRVLLGVKGKPYTWLVLVWC